MAKKVFSYPIKSLGADYIHSNQDNFVETFNSYSALNEMDKIFEYLKGKLKAYVRKELNFYKAAEDVFIQNIKNNVKGTDLEKKLKGRVSILRYINQVRDEELKNKNTSLGKIAAAKDQIQQWQMQWFKKWEKDTEGQKDLDPKQFKKYSKKVPVIIEGLLASIEIIRLENEKENKGIFGVYSGVNFDKEIQTQEQLKNKMNKSIQDILGSKNEIIELEKIAKKGFNVNDQKSMKLILGKLVDIMAKIYVGINQKFGLLAEEFEVAFVEQSLPFMTDGSIKVVGADFKDFQIMDVQTMEATVQKTKNVKIGFSEKFTRNMNVTRKYTSTDIFDTMAAYAKAKEEQKLIDTIEKNKFFIKYLRRNIISLSIFNLRRESIDNILNPYIKLEKELALIRGYTRFFNQLLIMTEEGVFSPFGRGSKKEIVGVNALLVFKQGVFWTRDFIELAYESIDTNVKDGVWGSKSDIFSGKANFKIKGNDAKKSKLAALWNEKLKVLRSLEKEQVSYKALLGSKDIVNAINAVFGKGVTPRLVDSMTYTLNMSKFKKKK